jgi:hypothetical protein
MFHFNLLVSIVSTPIRLLDRALPAPVRDARVVNKCERRSPLFQSRDGRYSLSTRIATKDPF